VQKVFILGIGNPEEKIKTPDIILAKIGLRKLPKIKI
tara:strand:+ start:206 stop:316 length:111 start_codon:yes stop_codon:yes gene_type:complete